MGQDTDVHEILVALSRLQDLYADSATKAAERSIAKVIELLTPHDGKSMETLAAEFRAAASSGAGKETAALPVDESVVERYVQALNAGGTDSQVFKKTFDALSKDASVKAKEADSIARQFTRLQAPFKTKKAALTAIKRTFLERARFENKLRAVS